MQTIKSVILIIISALFLTACGGGGSSSGTNNVTPDADAVDTSVYYPADIVVASPLEPDLGRSRAVITPVSISSQLAYIASLLSAGSITACTFNPELFLQEPTNASCYGPTIDYLNHPGGGDGELPGGDVGIWAVNEGATTEACSAAEMNARMTGVSNKSYAGFTALASMICVNTVGGYGLPSSSTNDIVTDMNAMAVANSIDAVFSTATITHTLDGTDNVFTYVLEFEYTDALSVVYPISMTVVHKSDGSGDFVGHFQYKYDSSFDGSNCPVVGLEAPVTIAGSVHYERTGTEYAIDARYADFCGNGAAGFVGGIVNPTDKYDAGTNADGWGDNYNRFLARFDEGTYEGDYTYSWQAGYLDGNTRTLNISVDKSLATGLYSAESWFGYGDDASTSDNSIGGFICNWAGPGNDHTYQDLVQYQSMAENASTGVFEAVVNNILYAPTNTCDDTDALFVYDTDADGDLSDENAATVISNDLEDIAVYQAGFTAPAGPTIY